MNCTHRILLWLILLAPLTGRAQTSLDGTVEGIEADGSSGPLPGANVFWAGTTIGTATDGDGHFTLPEPPAWPAILLTSYMGYGTDSLRLGGMPGAPVIVRLRASNVLREAEVVERQSGSLLSTRNTFNLEQITQKELKRAACCDLSESFETNATVDVSFSDAVSGTKTIKMLGLDGRYALISLENIPFVRGLSSSYGLSLIPGTWIQGINVSKGNGPVVNGFSSMTGQIDLTLVQPRSAEPLFVNLYANDQGRLEANVQTAQKLGKRWHNLLMVHGNFLDTRLDDNRDGFLDQPLGRRINILDRVQFEGDGRDAHLGVRYVLDERTGGQSAFRRGEVPEVPLYGLGIDNEMVDVFGKHGFIFKNDPTRSIGMIGAIRRHTVEAFFGNRTYNGTEESGSFSAIYQQLLGDGNDQVKAGLTFSYADYTEQYEDSAFGRTERVPGAFVEHTLKRGSFTAVSGLRVDHNTAFGTFVSPRLHLKQDLGPLTALRGSAGSGWRTANPYVENATALASARTVIVTEDLEAEQSWNFGIGFLHKFKWHQRKWAVGADAYRTQFTQQLVADLDRSAHELVLSNLHGSSFANTVQADLQVELFRALQLKLAYRWYDTRTTYHGVELQRPFVPEHRAMADLAFTSRSEKWRCDLTLNWFGSGRIPDLSGNEAAVDFGSKSPAYSVLHAQITRVFGPVEVYLGVENLLDYIQDVQIIAPEDPFGPNFDAAMIWGPTNGRMIYGGLRFALKKNDDK